MNRNRRIGLLLAFACFVAVRGLAGAGWLSGTENALLASCFHLRGPAPAASEVAIVAIDPATLRSGLVRVWPPPLDLYAQVVKQLAAAQAAVIVLDVEPLATFGAQQTNPREQERLVGAMRQSAKVILPCVLQPAEPEEAPATGEVPDRFSLGSGTVRAPRDLQGGRLVAPAPPLCAAAAGIGQINLYPDTDGVVRSLPLVAPASDKLWPALTLEAVRVYQNLPPGSARYLGKCVKLGDATFAVTSEAEMIINFSGGFRHYPQTSLLSVLRGDPGQLRGQFGGKLVLVGPTASTALRRTPTNPLMPGVEITANAVGNLLHGTELRRPRRLVTILCGLLAALLVGWIVPAAGPLRGALAVLGVAAGLCAIMGGLFLVHIWMPMSASLWAVFLSGAALVTHAAAVSDRDRARAEARLDSRLQAITGIGGLIVSSVDRAQLLSAIVRWVERELEVPAVSILLMDDKRKQLRFEVASGEKGTEVKSFTLELGQGVAGTVAMTGEPLIVQEARKDPRQARDISDAVGFPTESILCVPMKLHGEVIGVIEALNKRSGPFTDFDESLLTVIGQQAALFLESARLYSELQQRVDDATAGLRAANQGLAIQKAKIEALVDEMEAGVIATDAHDRVVTWNQTAEQLVGLPEARAVGQPLLAVVNHPRLSALFALPLTPLGGHHSEEMEFLVGRRTVIARVSVTLVAEDEGYGKLAVLTDITQLKELDRMKMDLLSFVSHELRTPLSTIEGFAHIIQQGTDESSPNARYIRLLRNQASRMYRLVEDLLDVARIEAGIALDMRWQQIDDVAALIQEIVDLFALSTTTHQFVIEVSPDTPALWADRGKLEQVLQNMIGNAVKYSPDGGEIRVTVTRYGRDVMFAVADEGIGISEEDLPNLFQRFQRARETRERITGTGIGLFLSRHLVEAHGGEMWAESSGKGSVFRFTIPVPPREEEAL